MESLCLEVKKLHPNATLPTKAHEYDAGFDLHAFPDNGAYITEIDPWSSKLIGTGVGINLPAGSFGYIRSRSGLASKENLEVGAGVVDPGYVGELRVLLRNHSDVRKWVKAGDRIAQLLVLPVPDVKLVELPYLGKFSNVPGERGDRGFGSSGV